MLLVQVDETNLLPSSVCKMCICHLEFLEKVAVDLQDFRELAQHSMSTHQSYGPLKRTRVTSSDVGVSPDMAKERSFIVTKERKWSFHVS